MPSPHFTDKETEEEVIAFATCHRVLTAASGVPPVLSDSKAWVFNHNTELSPGPHIQHLHPDEITVSTLSDSDLSCGQNLIIHGKVIQKMQNVFDTNATGGSLAGF